MYGIESFIVIINMQYLNKQAEWALQPNAFMFDYVCEVMKRFALNSKVIIYMCDNNKM